MSEQENSFAAFINGLFLGALAGACGLFLFGTKKGRKIKDKLFKEGKKVYEELEESLEELEEKKEKTGAGAVEKAGKELQERAESIREAAKEAGAALQKRFFTKNGKQLK